MSGRLPGVRHRWPPVLLTSLIVAASACKAEAPADAPPAADDRTSASAADPTPAPVASDDSDDEPPRVTMQLGLVDEAARLDLAGRLGGESFDALVAVEHRVVDGWHIYWRNPGETGLKTKLDVRIEDGSASAGEVLYPAPDRLVAEGGQVGYGWEGRPILFVPVTGADGKVVVRSRWLACREACVQGRSEATLDLGAGAAAAGPSLAAMLERIPEPAGDRVALAWSEQTLELRSTAGQLDAFFPYARDGALFDGVEARGDGLAVRYRLDDSATGDEPAALGVLRLTPVEGAARWLEITAPWPDTENEP